MDAQLIHSYERWQIMKLEFDTLFPKLKRARKEFETNAIKLSSDLTGNNVTDLILSYKQCAQSPCDKCVFKDNEEYCIHCETALG